MRSRPREVNSLILGGARSQRTNPITEMPKRTRFRFMHLPFIKRCRQRAFFQVKDFVTAEDRIPRLVSRIESALYAAGVQPEGANTPRDVIWVCVQDSKLSIEQITDLIASFGLTVHYLGDSYDNL